MGGDPVRRPVPGHQLPGGGHPGRPRSHRTANGLVPDHAPGGRRRVVSRRRPDRDGPGPHPGRQHRLRGLPAPVVLPGSRRIHAPPVRLPRRPAGVHDRHRRPGRHGLRPAGRLRRQRHGPDSPVYARRLPGVHAVPVRDGRSLVAAARAQVAQRPDHQRRWGSHDGRHRRRRGQHKILVRSMDRGPPDSAPDGPDARHPTPLSSGRGGPHAGPSLRACASPQHRRSRSSLFPSPASIARRWVRLPSRGRSARRQVPST